MKDNKTNTIKQLLYSSCQAFVETRLHTIQIAIKALQQSLHAETKSSAGDKHETGRAMVQLEREKLGQQLAEIQRTNTVLSKINVEKVTQTIGLGSVVYTNKANYYIAISIGEMYIDDTPFYAISSSTPIGQLLMGKSIGDTVVFRNENISIQKVI